MSKTMRELKEEWSDTEKDEMRKEHRYQFGLDGAFDPDEYIFKVQSIKPSGIKLKPKQYQIAIDTFQRAKANMTKEQYIACMKFNIDKYNWRDKGQDIEDFKKIIDYAIEAISALEGN